MLFVIFVFELQLYLENGKIKVQLVTNDGPEIILDNYEQTFNDGKWHNVNISLATNTLILDVDQRPMITNRLLSITTGPVYYIAGIRRLFCTIFIYFMKQNACVRKYNDIK